MSATNVLRTSVNVYYDSIVVLPLWILFHFIKRSTYDGPWRPRGGI